MMLLRVDRNTCKPVQLIEGYKSLTWNERFLPTGDFEIVFSDVQRGMDAIGINQWLTLEDTKEMMVVDSKLISRDDEGVTTLKITGRAFATWVLDQRIVAKSLSGAEGALKPWRVQTENGWDMVEDMVDDIWKNQIHTGDHWPPTVPGSTDTLGLDIRTNQMDLISDGSRKVSVEPQGMLEAVMQQLPKYGQGIRTFRPPIPNYDGIGFTSFDHPMLEVYSGRNRTKDQPDHVDNMLVTLSVAAGHFQDVSYLFSQKNYKTSSYVFSPLDARTVGRLGDSEVGRTGRNRRGYFHRAEIDQSITGTELQDLMIEAGRADLAKHQKEEVFEGKVAANIPYTYNVDFRLGDIVHVQAEYNIDQAMRVTEYLRTEDEDGEISYPTLSFPMEPA